MPDAGEVTLDAWTRSAFLAELHSAVDAVAALIPPPRLQLHGQFTVLISAEAVTIPTRIYSDEISQPERDSLSATERLVLDCLYSLHHNGRICERCAARIVTSQAPWVLPYVVQLVGEYVLTIIDTISTELSELTVPGSPQQRAYGAFVRENPEFVRLTGARVISYWNCHYRNDYLALDAYPPHHLAEALEAAARLATDG